MFRAAYSLAQDALPTPPKAQNTVYCLPSGVLHKIGTAGSKCVVYG